ncbi:MAG: DNA polymerase Y family protein [Gluconacetobacter diazotrophicus]|nr:DNA polymerase Y family protein [Gluconacetobacter diazotrophicus]
MRRVVSLWLPFWPTDRLRRRLWNALPAEVPLVTRVHDGRRLVVGAGCARARQLGLDPGMPLAHAQALVPGLVIADAVPEEDALALARLAAWCLDLSPVTAADPPDGVWIDLSGCAHLHGGERAALAALSAQLRRLGFAVRAAVADTPGAAHALARHAARPCLVSGPGKHPDALASLPVAALRIPADTAAVLRRLGLELIGQLAAAPRAPLARRFGSALLLRLDQALGRAPEPIVPVLPPGLVEARRVFAEPVLTPEAFAAAIRLLVEDICRALEARGQGARRLDLLFERVDALVWTLRVGTARPVRDPPHLCRLLVERLAEVDPGLGVESMRLVVGLCETLSWEQAAAAAGGTGTERGSGADLSRLVDRLANRFGADSIRRLELAESDVPERSERPVPGTATVPAARIPLSPWPRPVRLLRRPEPVAALAALPDHPPRAFTWRGARHLVQHADGPERVTGEWWRRDAELWAVRDYWIVETGDGRRFWLFRQGDGQDEATGSRSWFLHGFF